MNNDLEAVDFASFPAPLSAEDLAKRIADRDKRAADEAAQEYERAWRAAIPARYRDAHPKNPALPERAWPVLKDGKRIPLPMVFERIASHDGAVTFLGPSGTGKSTIAVAALHERFRRMVVGSVVFAETRLLAIARMQHRGDGEAPFVREAMRARLLVLDDLGNERQIPTNACADVILHRYSERLPTWVTTGFDRDGLDKLYGGGVGRRVFEHALVIRCKRPEAGAP